ncbi:MAG: hypothetical protein K1X94_15035 [Sandaracinaceae bacterium]|nr:hypothetical protein [Sandaracinaceae bacterium]
MSEGSVGTGRRGMLAISAALAGVWLAGCPGPESTVWTEAFDAHDVGWLLNVASVSPSDVWAVGGSPDAGVARHYDGHAWSAVAVPSATPLLNWAMPFRTDHVIVVGNHGTVLVWNGASFDTQESGTTENLWGVWGASETDVWAVGGSGFEGSVATVIHWDGASWTPAALPTLERPNVFAFFKVWGSSADDVWVVGQRGAVVHYDGSAWTEELVGASDDLIAVWGTGPDHVVMVGGRSNAIVVTWDGTSFVSSNLAPLPGLNGVWMDNDRVFHVAGTEGTLATIESSGLVWHDDAVPATRLAYHSITGDSSGRLWSVGGSLSSVTAPFVGIASTRPRAASER